MLRKIAVTTCLTLAAMGVALPAAAVNWGPVTSTYKSQVRVKATGSMYVVAGRTGVQSSFKLVDPLADGNNVYGNVWYQFYRPGCTSDGSAVWCRENRKVTKEYAKSKSQDTWTVYLSVTNFRTDSSRVRGIHEACAQMGFPVPDSCSAGAYVTIDY
jgi:hypothetical protein